MRVDLGTTDTPPPGFDKYVDIVPNPVVPAGHFVLADLRQAWPFPDGSVTYFRARDLIEHLPDRIFTMNEMWRCLTPGGTAEIFVPTFDGVGAVCDPTHVSYWTRHNFDYFVAGTPEHSRFARHYGIKAKFKVISESKGSFVKNYLSGAETVRHLTIHLSAVKP